MTTVSHNQPINLLIALSFRQSHKMKALALTPVAAKSSKGNKREMVRSAKATNVKKKPADFKRPKRKVGRKAPQAANVTSVAISSRRINMLEQSVLQDKGDAVTHRHLSLQDLMAQIGHYNAHMRQRALQGLKELAQIHPSNVLANVSIVLERFLRTFVDEEAIVREAAVQTWKTLIAVMIEGKSLKPFAKLIAMYFCSGLTHLQIGIRQDTLRAISVLLEVAPELISIDAGLEQLGRLIENFRDLIAAAQSQGIKITNSYDLLTTSANSKKQQGDRGSDQAKSGKKKASETALALRFSALNVLHKLLLSIDFSDDELATAAKTSHKIVRDSTRMTPVAATPMLLLYPTPRLVVGNQSERLRSVGFWQQKSRTLLKPLLDLWIECLESDSIETLSEEYVENLQKVVECSTIILSANAYFMLEFPDSDLTKNARKIQEQLMVRFPMFPENNLTAGGDAYLSRWYGINVAIAKFACVLLKLPLSVRAASMKDLDTRVTEFVVSALTKYTTSDELRALSGAHLIIRGLLVVLTSVLASTSQPEHREELLGVFTQLYVKCSARSMTFRTCTSFVIDRLSDMRRWPSWPLVLQWLTCFGNFLGQLDTSHMELGRQSLFTMITVMKQLPTGLAASGAADTLLQNLEQFFNVNTEPSATQFRFDELSEYDQLEFVSLVYHLPNYPVGLLRALASCCKSPRVHIDAKSFLMDILHQRSDKLDLAHLVSFLMSGVLGRQDAGEKLTAAQKLEHLQLTRHVCRILLAMNLGASLAKILTPALARQASNLDSMTALDIHTLTLLFGACFASVKPIHRGELPTEMVNDVVRISNCALMAFGSSVDGQTQEAGMLSDLVSTLALSDGVIRRVVDELLQAGVSDSADTFSKRIRALQLLVQSTVLRQWVVGQKTHVLQRLQSFEGGVTKTATEEVSRLFRQVRGDLELVAVGLQQ